MDPTNDRAAADPGLKDGRKRGALLYSMDAAAAAIWPSTERLLGEDVVAAIAADAAAADARGLLSEGTVAQMRGAGYFGLPVPGVLGGGGAGLVECAAVQRRLGMADPALAIALNMHLFSVGIAVEHWLRHRDSCGLLLEAIATQRRIVASAFAEPGLGGALLRSTVMAQRTDGGYLVRGVKSPCSLAAECDLVCFQMQAEPPEPMGLMMAVLPLPAKGVRFERSWDALGMRASGSDTLVFENCFVPSELIYHRSEPGADDDEVFAAGLVWLCLTTTATYLGIAAAGIERACAALRGSRLPYLGAARSDLPSVQGQLGELISATLPLEAACASAARRLDEHRSDPRSILPIAVALKYAAVDACTRAVESAAELVGGRSYSRTSTLARLWRDVQASRFHPPTRLISRHLLGRWALGLPVRFELDERADCRD